MISKTNGTSLRTWHFFAWVFFTSILLLIANVQGIEANDPFKLEKMFHSIEWSISRALTITAFITLVRMRWLSLLPSDLLWCPGHVLLVFLMSHLVHEIASLFVWTTIGERHDGLAGFVQMTIATLYVIVIAILLCKGIALSKILLWRAFFVLAALVSFLESAYGFIFEGDAGTMLLNDAPYYLALLSICVLIGASIQDICAAERRECRSLWTHWAGVVIYAFTAGWSIVWNLVLPKYLH